MKPMLTSFLTLLTFTVFSQNWEQIGPYGGYFKDFFIHPTDPSTVYAGSDDGGGLWKTTDGGTNWELITADFPNMTSWKIVVSETNPSLMFVCDVYSRYGVLKSTDGGDNWEEKNAGLTSAYDKMVSGLVIMNEDTLIASTGEAEESTPPRPGNGLFISTDGGDNWEETGLQGWTIPCIDKNVFNTIFAGTESNGLWYSNDFGDSWLPHPDIPTSAKLHEIDVQNNVVAIAAVEGIFLSLDYGISFINTGLAGDINFDMCIHKISPDVELFASTFAGLQYYNTSTATWTLLSDPELDGQLIIGIESNGNEIYAGRFSNSLIIKSTDNGMSWNAIEKSPIATEINDLYVDPENENHLLASMMGSYNIGGTYNKEALRETNDGGLTWNNKGPVAHGLSLTMAPSNSATLYLGTFSSGLFKSTNHFDSHTQLISGNKLIADVAIHPENSEIVIVSQLDLDLISTSILKSTNGGTDFEETAIIGANRLGFNADFPDTVYAGTPDGIHLSDDMGENWSPWLLDGENVLSLHYANNTLYAGTDNGNLYRIVNGTAIEISGSWNTPSELKSIYSINGKLFAGLNGAEKDSTYNLSGSIWMSSDDGDNWTNITTEMTSTNVYGNNIIESNGTNLYLGTYGGGVYRSSDFNLSVESLSSQGIILPYPNPTSDQIILPNVHSISEAFVINQLGQKTQLSHHNFSQHKDGIQINLSELETGIYYLKVDDLPSMKLIVSN